MYHRLRPSIPLHQFGSWNASTVPYYSMDKYYKGIRECNILMQNVHKCSDPLATQKISIDTIGKPVLLAPTIIFNDVRLRSYILVRR